MTERLAIEGGVPVRQRPFPTWPVFGDAERDALVRVLESGRWGKLAGSEVVSFEKTFAAYHGAKHGIGVVNGTVALRLALLAAGIEAGDEVIVPPYTFLATASAVVECNATPIFADIQLDTFNLDPAAVAEAITPRTRAIIPVHLGGLPVDLDAILALADRHGLTVIEDAAHAHGAEYRGRRVGAIGQAGTFSFQSSKNVNSGEGGIILTNDDAFADRCWSAHNCGRRPEGKWYEHVTIGGNYRLSEFQGAILNAQWMRFEEQCATCEDNGKHLAKRLSEIPGVHPQNRGPDCTRHAYHVFVFRIDPEVFGIPRHRVVAALQAEGIPCTAGYVTPLYRQEVFEQRNFGPYTGYRQSRPTLDYHNVCCPNCETICCRQGIMLEHRLLLGSHEDMDDIAAGLARIYEHRCRLTTDGERNSR
jgi:dTDP-4-amino-4,6-dideoxygalactose transaminase